MQQENIGQHFETFKKHQFIGRSLAQLKQHYTQNPDFILKVCKEMGIVEMGQIMNISDAIRRL